jgi:hypothetical protein
MHEDITPVSYLTGSHRTGTLYDINVATIIEILGFAPNVQDDPDKVVNSWAFMVDGKKLAVWDYKGSHLSGQFSTYGDHEVMAELFGSNYA